MKKFENAEVVELTIKATSQEPTTEMAADLFQDGYFKQGVNSGSGPKESIDYYPNK